MEPEKIKIVIIEDEFVIAEDIRTRLEEASYEVSHVFDNGESALPFLLKSTPDIILVDINLQGKMDGIQLVEQLQQKISLPVAFITANSDPSTYDRARKTHPHAFLVKPFTTSNLLAAVDLALYHFSIETTPSKIERPVESDHPEGQFIVNQCLFVRTNGKYKKICPNDILFIEAGGSYVHIQSRTERHTLSQNLTHFQQKTPLPNLVRIHRSYIINIDHVDSFEESFVFIQNHKLPLSDNFRADFISHINCL
jgi:DNA-binding LytR/AlgR family response regulator